MDVSWECAEYNAHEEEGQSTKEASASMEHLALPVGVLDGPHAWRTRTTRPVIA